MRDRIFLFTDIEGSTTLWERFPERMRGALERHDSILRTIIESKNGCVFKTVGDSFCAVFPAVHDAIEAAAAAQHRIGAETWDEIGEPIRVRMAIHTGPADAREGDYFGPTMNRVARILASAHGGQIVLSKAAVDVVADRLPPASTLVDLGEHRLKDLVRPERIFQYGEPGLREEFPLLRSLSAFAHNLPEQLTTFIGREKELAEIKHLMSRARLLTLSGSGGNGKSRLALQVAAEMVDEFTNGVWFVDVATVLDPSLIATMVAFFFSSRRRHTRYIGDWSSDVCSSDLRRAFTRRTACAESGLTSTACHTSKAPNSHARSTRSLAGCASTPIMRNRRGGTRSRSEERRVGEEGKERREEEDAKKYKREI